MITVEQAREAILAEVRLLPSERLSILQAAGRVSAESVHAQRQQPPWDYSAMDGYALRSEDVTEASDQTPVRLEVIEDLMAGVIASRTVGKGQAARIMTGAPIPPGADAVIRVEVTRAPSRDLVDILEAAPPGNDIRRAGEDQEVGDLLVPKGRLLRPAEIGVLAAAPRAFVEVVRAPTVAIISTGDELAEPDVPPRAGQIINTSAYALAAMVQEVGGRPLVLPIARDTREDLTRVLRMAAGADVLLTTGGVSVGEHDFVKDVLLELGVKLGFWKVKMTPGKPLAFGRWGDMLVFGLPGNPVSSLVSFELFVRPALLKMAGHRRIFRAMFQATLRGSVKKRPGMPHFLRVILEREWDGWSCRSTGPQGSGVLRSMTRADALAVGPEGVDVVEDGAQVWVMPLDGQHGMAERWGE